MQVVELGNARAGDGAAAGGRRLVAVFAHPDDESFGPGGTFARYAAAGLRMTLVCGTRGEAGTIGHSAAYGPELLARIRQAEVEAAAEVLGFRQLVLLGYPDRQVESMGLERGAAEVLAILRGAEPDAVVAFHPTGISGHPDHRAMTAFTAAACERLWAESAGRDPAADWRARLRLHYFTLPASVTRHIDYRVMPQVPDEDVTIVLDVRPFAEVRRRAIRCHQTQLAFYERLTSLPGPDGRFEIERFVTHGAPRRAVPATDLFAEL
jgi:LmbE family N-acetylglucosaminyl deacetylase